MFTRKVLAIVGVQEGVARIKKTHRNCKEKICQTVTARGGKRTGKKKERWSCSALT